MIPPLLWISLLVIICVLAFFWFRSMESTRGRLLVLLAAFAAVLYVTVRLAMRYPAATPNSPTLDKPATP